MILRVQTTLAACLLFVSFSVAAAQEQRSAPGIFGEDDRRIVDNDVSPWNAVGHVNTSGYSRRILCTGTLVGPRTVVTAAHCVRRYGSDRAYPLGDIHFVAGVKRGKYLGHSTASCIKFVDPARAKNAGSWARYVRDVAIVVLKQRIDVASVEMIVGDAVAAETRLWHAGYPRNRRFLPSLDDNCHIQRKTRGVWLTDCDTNFGSSGGPVFVRAGGGMKLAAIIVGIVPFEASVAIPAGVWADLAADPRCD